MMRQAAVLLRHMGPDWWHLGTAYLEKDLQHPMHNAHPAPEEQEEGHKEFQEVVAECLKLVEPPG